MADSIIHTQTCTSCKETLSTAEFYHRHGKPRSHCKACHKARSKPYSSSYYLKNREAIRRKYKENGGRQVATRKTKLKTRYGLTPEGYETLLLLQNNCCAICKSPSSKGRWERFHVDHDHATGSVRGLLCNHCNITLGRMGDSLEGVLKFVDYLKKQ